MHVVLPAADLLRVNVQWLEIKPTDDEKTVQRKKKLIKSYKSKARFQEMDMAQKAKKDNWQSFLSGKATKKKTGMEGLVALWTRPADMRHCQSWLSAVRMCNSYTESAQMTQTAGASLELALLPKID